MYNKIAIIGDAILDENFVVDVKNNHEIDRPLFSILNKKITKPGGAANICCHLENFEISFDYYGLLDQESFCILDNYFNVYNSILLDNCNRNSRKKRFYENGSYLFRIDDEKENYGFDKFALNEYQNRLCKNIKKEKYDIAILSDYNKGLFNYFDINNYFSSLNNDCLKIVDPKKGPVSKWRGCDIIKPNQIEAKDLSKKDHWKDQAEFIKKETNAKAVLITQAADGVVGIIENDFFEFRPFAKVIPNSVVGAGDCFVGLFAYALFSNKKIKESVEYAFNGSSKFVVDNKFLYPFDLVSKKSIDYRSLINRDFTLCFTNGCFDILHLGHIELLKFAKSKADKLVVALNSNKSVNLQNKSHSLINDLEIRRKIIESLEFVDFVIDFDEVTPYDLIKKIKPDVLVKGSDYENPVGSDIVLNVEKFDILDDFSTTKFIEKIKKL